MRMPVHQLAGKAIQNVIDRKCSLLFGHHRIEKHLQQEIAEFAGKLFPVAIVDGLKNFIGFFEGIGLDGIKGLLAIPRTAAGGPQALHDGDCSFEPFAGCGHCQPL